MRAVALLRGINVGRGRRVAMADLRAAVTAGGFADVSTVLASGNLVFAMPARAQPAAVAARLEAIFADALGLATRATVVTGDDLAATATGRPPQFAKADGARLLVGFPRVPGALDRLAPLKARDWAPAALVVTPRAAWLWCPGGVLADDLFEEVNRALRDDLTTRNWNTVQKLHAALGAKT